MRVPRPTRWRLTYLRSRSIFIRLIVSYTGLILLVVVLVGAVSFASFWRGFKEEITGVHQRMRSFIVDTVGQYVFAKANSLYLDLALKQGLGSSADHASLLLGTPAERSVNILNAYRFLSQIAGYESDIVDSIDVYYRRSRIVVSSSAGVKFLDSTAKTWYDHRWIEEFESARTVKQWRRVAADGQIRLAMMASIRATGSDESASGIIAINLKEQKLYEYLRRFVTSEKEAMFIIDGNGDIVSHTDREQLFRPVKTEPYIRDILASPRTADDFIADIDGEKSIVFHSVLPETGWRLVSTIRVGDFYRRAFIIRTTILATCGAVVFLGILLAYLLSARLYHPLRAIADRLQKRFGVFVPSQGASNDEYKLIDGAIDAMSQELHRLENTIQANKPIIKANLIRGLFSRSITTEPELRNRLRLLDVRLEQERFVALIVRFGSTLSHDAVAAGAFEETVRFIESLSDARSRFLACEDGEEGVLALAAASPAGVEDLPRVIETIVAHLAGNLVLPAFVCRGDAVANPLEVHRSFAQARAALCYRYFKPTAKIMEGREFQQRDRCQQRIPDEILRRMATALPAGDAAQTKACLAQLVQCCESEAYAAAECHERLQDLVSLVGDYVRSHAVLVHRIGGDLRGRFAEVRDIAEYQTRMGQLLEEIAFHTTQSRKNRDLIEMVKAHVVQNLGLDLSLTSVAAKMAISPNYLSKMFKDETGEHFVEFVIEQRMHRARELLEGTTLSVEEVSRAVGYNTTTYFIKRFRERFGLTPKHFRSYARINA